MIKIVKTGCMKYVKTPEMIIQYSNDMEKLNETELGYIYGLKDEKTKKIRTIFTQ